MVSRFSSGSLIGRLPNEPVGESAVNSWIFFGGVFVSRRFMGFLGLLGFGGMSLWFWGFGCLLVFRVLRGVYGVFGSCSRVSMLFAVFFLEVQL